MNIIDKIYYNTCPYPYLSTLMSSCIANGKAITAGGAKYNLITINGCGMANTSDSLAAIKKAVYEDKLISLQELKEVLLSNFEGNEPLRKRLLNRIPKYGNDDNYVDIIMKDLSEFFCKYIMKHLNTRGGKFQAGLYTVETHSVLGKSTGALPDGRKVSEVLANGLSPSQGRDKIGPTAVIRSNTKIDHSLIANGMVLDIKFHPTALSGKEGLQKFKSLIRTYLNSGGMEIQFNVVDRKTLLEAQKNPEKFSEFVVRVSGYSAYFTQLSKELQNEIIARTEYN
jgi:formate C-acetyltransferase